MKILYVSGVWIFTLIVCCLHIHTLTRQYLLYATTTKITIRQEETIDIPAVVVCMSSSRRGESVSDFLTYQHIEQERTVRHFYMMDQACGPELRGVCDSGRRSKFVLLRGQRNISKVISVTRFARGRERCFAFCMLQKRLDATRAASMITFTVYWLQFQRAEESPSDLTYYLVHPDYKHPVVDSRNQLTLYYHRVGNVKLPIACLNYQRRETRLLESPYDTHCRYYSQIGQQSQLHCLNDCISRMTQGQLNIIPEDVSIFESTASKARFRMSSDRENSTFSLTISSIRKSCNQKCNNEDCLQHSFQPYSNCDLKSIANVTLADIYLNVPNFPLILIEAHVFIPFKDFLMTSLNIVSLWIAFSPIQMAIDYAFVFTDLLPRPWHASLVFDQKLRSMYARFFKLSIMMTCLICCMWQLRESADQYFKYPTISKVVIKNEDPISIPAVTLCNDSPTQFNNRSYVSVFQLFQNDSFYFIHYDGPGEKVFIHDYYCLTAIPKIKSKQISDPRDNVSITFGVRHLRKPIRYFRCLVHDADTRVRGHFMSYSILS